MARIVVVSFRLGGNDGVAIESAKWIAAIETLGHNVRTVAGEGVADVILPESGDRRDDLHLDPGVIRVLE